MSTDQAQLGDTKPPSGGNHAPPSHPSPASDPITVQVGERRFVTFRSTLTSESPYFQRLISAQRERTQADGSYFVDADESLFTYILRYLRSGALPIFYTSNGGHDYGMYQALLGGNSIFPDCTADELAEEQRIREGGDIHIHSRRVRGSPKSDQIMLLGRANRVRDGVVDQRGSMSAPEASQYTQAIPLLAVDCAGKRRAMRTMSLKMRTY
ncbi:hypothetical protein CLCR_10829 [Cladophialophora carrionii]|uniref:BTB domain-containing protein n=1 Tax=Cladophialophora carrionii TaxID=86049 RepID=A0A1C1CVG7_9EURO|nr:hypothetical protein CLCR_10829 [Cladophialophora carrionii]